MKAMLAVSLRAMEDTNYLFCRTQTCRIVYFSAVTETTFSVGHLRERVYQKEPEANNISICYCFRHTIGKLRTASSAERAAILEDINNGIRDGQCACDLRNPQGSCCLGNVQTMLRRLEAQPIGTG